jgi:hypothetical protein
MKDAGSTELASFTSSISGHHCFETKISHNDDSTPCAFNAPTSPE